jgi:2-oxoglutarate dehydrogenase E2 component (dihydrolipoamide succinyltransferase)
MTDIRVPTLGESVTEATIGKWFKKPGERVAVDEPLVELETDKVTIEVPAPASGILSEIRSTMARPSRLGRCSARSQGARRQAVRCRRAAGSKTALFHRSMPDLRSRSCASLRRLLPSRRAVPQCASTAEAAWLTTVLTGRDGRV